MPDPTPAPPASDWSDIQWPGPPLFDPEDQARLDAANLVPTDETEMKATRIDEVEGNGFPFPLLKPGEYGKSLAGVWYVMCPRATDDGMGYLGNLSRHQVTEHDDGTITVSPSILVKRHDGEWHGFLERGVWREC